MLRMYRTGQKPLKNAARLKKIISVFGKHGFQHILHRIGLSRSLLGKYLGSSGVDSLTTAEHLRMAFEELGPTFIKLGQLLAARPDLIPVTYVDEFKRLHDQVRPEPYESIERILSHHFGKEVSKVFGRFDKEPLGAASIAQVHRATLMDGQEVVVKVQKMDVAQIIQEDLPILYALAELIEKYVPESRPFNPRGIIDEFSKALQQETNFVIEANNIRRFGKNFAEEPSIRIPKVFSEYTGRRVLVLEYLEGIPLSQKSALSQEGIDPEVVLKSGLHCYLKMVFTDGLFHGDLHAGNIMVLPNNQIGLVDFGIVGRLNGRTKKSIASMLLALIEEDYDRLAYEYVDLAPFSGYIDVDQFARQLRDLIAPYYGLTLKNINIGKILMDSASVAAENKLILPSELILFFKSLVSIEAMGRVISKDFDFLSYAMEFSGDIIRAQYEPQKMLKDLGIVANDLNSLLYSLPKQLKQFLRRLNNPDLSLNIRLKQMEEMDRSAQSAARRISGGLVVASLLLSATLIFIYDKGPTVNGLPTLALVGYLLALVVAWF